MKPSIYSLTRQEMIDWAEENGEKKFRAAQIWEWLYRKRVQSFEEMTNLSKDLIAKLNDQFVVNPLKQRIVQESADGTVKYLFELPDGIAPPAQSFGARGAIHARTQSGYVDGLA